MADWRRRAACRGLDTDLFYPWKDMLLPPPAILTICEGCPVRAQCLLTALTENEPGIWGGTTEVQRRHLRRHYRRSSCPSCRGAVVTFMDDRQVCAGCGLSWLATKTRTSAGIVTNT